MYLRQDGSFICPDVRAFYLYHSFVISGYVELRDGAGTFRETLNVLV